MLWLLACRDPEPTVRDADGDGVPAARDCDDSDPARSPDREETAGDGIDQDCDGLDPLAEVVSRGTDTDEGYGHRVAFVAGKLVVGAPFHGGGAPPAGRVYVDGAATEGPDGAWFGAAVVPWTDTALVGGPGVGTVRTLGGDVLLDLPGAGGVLAVRGERWIASTATGAILDDGTRIDVDQKPDALALTADGAPILGFARGETAVRIGETTISRDDDTDEAGYALLLADTDGDGAEELLVGAPGSGRVYSVDPAAPPAELSGGIGPGEGRFGAALAWDGTTLWVGAPMAGAEVTGAVYRVEGDAASSAYTGESAGDQLGFSLAAQPGNLAMGAPGGSGSPGSVRVVAP